MPPARENEGGVDPVTFALMGILGIAGWCAWRVVVAAQAVIAASEDKNTYAIFVTDEGLKSDNQQLADEVNKGIAALRSAEGEAGILLLICSVLAICLTIRLFKDRPKAVRGIPSYTPKPKSLRNTSFRRS